MSADVVYSGSLKGEGGGGGGRDDKREKNKYIRSQEVFTKLTNSLPGMGVHNKPTTLE